MIVVRWVRPASGKMSMTVEGHGEEIVCAAVSALTQGFVATLQSIAESYPESLTVIDDSPPSAIIPASADHDD